MKTLIKKSFLALAMLMLLPMTMMASEIVEGVVTSKILGTDIGYVAYLPDGFNADDKSVEYPVLYLLHGLSDDQYAWTKKGTMREVADMLMRTGDSKRMVVIMPQAGTSDVVNTHCGYFNVPGWNYEDFFIQELMPTVEKRYNIGQDRRCRALRGLSMGGGGTVILAMHHPDLFCAAYAQSAWLNAPQAKREDYKSDWQFYTHDAVYRESAIRALEKATQEQKDAWKTVNWFIDCGDEDFLLGDNFAFYVSMKLNGMPIELRVRDGWHFWEYWHKGLYTMFPFVSRCMK